MTFSGGGGPPGGGSSGSNPCDPGFNAISGQDQTVDQFLIDAYNTFEGTISTPWHRDNIYYQLTPTQTTNSYIGGRYSEAVTYFTLQGDPEISFDRISDQSGLGNNDAIDANHGWDHDRRNRTPWTDGFFEFEISILDNAVNRGFKNTPRHFAARPEQLFEYTQEKVTRTRGAWPVTWQRSYWRPIISGLKGMRFTNGESDNQTLNIHPWDLLLYSNSWTVGFSEYDTAEDIRSNSSTSTTFNTNVEASTTFTGDSVKTGLKYGSSIERNESEEITTEVKLISDKLGEMDVFFYDRVLNRNQCDNKLYPRLYSPGQFEFELRPVQVEF
jgi:hypothetical protein